MAWRWKIDGIEIVIFLVVFRIFSEVGHHSSRCGRWNATAGVRHWFLGGRCCMRCAAEDLRHWFLGRRCYMRCTAEDLRHRFLRGRWNVTEYLRHWFMRGRWHVTKYLRKWLIHGRWESTIQGFVKFSSEISKYGSIRMVKRIFFHREVS